MKKYLLTLLCFSFIAATSLFAQQSNVVKNITATPHIVNFSALSAYQLKHPNKNKPHGDVEQGEERDKNFKFKPKPVPSTAVSYNITLPKSASRSVSPAPTISFNGTMDADYLTPPDINGVVGDSLIMETNNQEYDVFTKGGLLVNAVYLNPFYGVPANYFVFDPHLVYDAQNKRYIVVADCLYPNGHGGVFIGVSQTGNPTGNWNIYNVDVMQDPSHFLDFPMVGYNKNWIVVTTNNFYNNYYADAQLDVFNKDSIYRNLPVVDYQFLDTSMISLSPAATDDSLLNTEYFVEDWNGDSLGIGYVRVCALTGAVNAPVYTQGQVIGVNHPWNENDVEPAQLGSSKTFYSVDTRVDFAKYINGSLWFSHTVFLPASAPTYDAIDWWQVNPATSVVQQYGRIADDTTGNTFYFFPAIDVNSNNDALLGYATSSYSGYCGAAYVYRSANDAKNTMQDGYLFQPGLASYAVDHGDGLDRWGDFTGTAVDPSNNSFWTFQEYANLPINTWGTVIANVSAPTCTGTPAAGFISASKDTICSGAKAILQLYGNTIAENGIQIQWQQSLTGTGGWTNVSSSISTVASELVSPPLNQTTYFRCQTACSNSNKTSTTAPVVVYVYGLNSVSNDTVCTPGTYNLVANALGNTKWYATDTSIAPLSIGDTLKAAINNASTYYVTVDNPGSNYRVGITDNTIGSGALYHRFDEGLEFTALNNFVIDSVFIYPYTSGIAIVNLVDNTTNIVLQSDTFVLPANSINQKTKLALNMPVEGGFDYKLNAVGTIDSGFYCNTTSLAFPYVVPGVISINRPIDFQIDYNPYYFFFYDWHLSTGCNSARIPVHVAIDTTAVSISAPSDSLCHGDSIELTATGATSYSWSPGNLSGNAITVNPTTTTTYSVTGTDVYGCTGNSTFIVNVKNCTSGINVVSNTITLKVYPDPASDFIKVQLGGTIPANTYLEIDNVLGQQLVLNKMGSSAVQSINISSFSSGLYLYKLKSGNELLAKGKFVKE